MGPKKKAKAPKKTKEQLEEERRLQEEEEARLRAEEEKRIEEARLKREAEAARRREENAKNRAAELGRLTLEHEGAKQDLEGKAVRLAELLRVQKEAKDWDNYLACQPRPDAQVEGDMNSFLNSWQLDTATLELELPAVTAACESATEVMEDLTFVAANACATNDEPLSAQCARFIGRLQELVVEKVDLTTAHVLQFADEYADLLLSTPNSSNNVNASRGEVKLASASPNTGWVQLGLWVNLLAKGSSRNKRVEFSELGVNVDLPKAVITQSLALRVTRWPFDAFSFLSEGGGSYVALGGVFSLELLAVPSPPKRARGWIMREVPDAREQLKRLHYPLDGMVLSAALPIKASLTLPKNVLFAPTTGSRVASAEVPRIGWWDTTRMRWEEEGVTDVVFQEDTSTVTFSTLRLTHLALLARRDRNFHKRSWRLCMDTNPSGGTITDDFHGGSPDNELGDMRARLTLSTAVFPRVQFEITPQGARLVEPSLPQLEALRKETMPPGELLTRLARAGIDLCPPLELEREKRDDGHFSFGPKLKMLEDRVIDEIASVVAGFEITDGNGNAEWGRTNGAAATRWPNAIGNNKQIVFSVKEMSWPYMSDDHEGSQQQAGEDEGVNTATSAASILVLAEVDDEASGGRVKFRLDRKGDSDAVNIAMTPREGDSETADGGPQEEEDIYDTHVHLRRALDEISSPDARDRIDNSHVLFELTLQKMLRLLRLLSYSQPPPLRGKAGVKQGKAGEGVGSETTAASPTTNAAEATAEPDTKGQEEPHEAVTPESAAQEAGEAISVPTE
ncbi:Dynein axonemal intermediate chain 7 [Phytophthora ramorum]|uniref:Dynein axonemal intermediate chain 7 n=1 Tax=Phytophthora ramorum TaxID=164328 RepID=UPI00309C9F42|nr:Dynein axonemal intermediate chain 7 [Phytophthora ramorum]